MRFVPDTQLSARVSALNGAPRDPAWPSALTSSTPRTVMSTFIACQTGRGAQRVFAMSPSAPPMSRPAALRCYDKSRTWSLAFAVSGLPTFQTTPPHQYRSSTVGSSRKCRHQFRCCSSVCPGAGSSSSSVPVVGIALRSRVWAARRAARRRCSPCGQNNCGCHGGKWGCCDPLHTLAETDVIRSLPLRFGRGRQEAARYEGKGRIRCAHVRPSLPDRASRMPRGAVMAASAEEAASQAVPSAPQPPMRRSTHLPSAPEPSGAAGGARVLHPRDEAVRAPARPGQQGGGGSAPRPPAPR